MQTRPAVVFTKTRTRTPTLMLSPILRPETIRALVLSKTHVPNKTEPAPALLITITAPISSKIHATSKIGLVKVLLITIKALVSSKMLAPSKIGQAKGSHSTIMAPATSNPLASTKLVLDLLTIIKAHNMPTMLTNIRTLTILLALLLKK